MQGSESIIAINTLANNAFKYQIILSNKTVSPITCALYVFNLSIDLQYNDTEFKELLMDSNASTRSISGIGQLKTL